MCNEKNMEYGVEVTCIQLSGGWTTRQESQEQMCIEVEDFHFIGEPKTKENIR